MDLHAGGKVVEAGFEVHSAFYTGEVRDLVGDLVPLAMILYSIVSLQSFSECCAPRLSNDAHITHVNSQVHR